MGSQQPGSESDILNSSTRSVPTAQKRERSRQYVASRGAGNVIADVIPENSDAMAKIEVMREGEGTPFAQLRLGVRGPAWCGGVSRNRSRRPDVCVRGEHPEDGLAGCCFRGALFRRWCAGRYLRVASGRRSAVTALCHRIRGWRCLFPAHPAWLRQRAGRRISQGRCPRAIDVRPAATAQKIQSGNEPIVAMRPLTRQQTIETAFAFEGIQWKLTPAAYGRDPDTACTGFNGRVRRPTYLHGKLGQEVRGVPYCWGCHGSLEQIRTKIERGVLAGNICTHNAPRSDAAGVDCSAFVSATWGLATHYTTAAIPAIATQLRDPWELRPGDALNKPGSHVMLFLRFTPDRKAEVMEASPGACNGRVCRNIYPLASLLARGYQPVRFRALQQDASVVSIAAPEKVENKRRQASIE